MSSRRLGVASTAVLAGLTLALGLAHAIDSRLAERLGLDVWNLPDLRAQARAADEEAAEIERREEEMARRIGHSCRVAGRLVDGTLTLAGAVDELEPERRHDPALEVMPRGEYRAATRRHTVALYAIRKARYLLIDDPSRWAAVSARLEAEYAALE